MRTTLPFDPNVEKQAKALAQKLGWSFKRVINEALRPGQKQMLRPKTSEPYRTRPRRMRLRHGLSLDKILELIAKVEGADAR